VIRFSAVLVVAAIGVLIGGIATSKLLLVYVAIGLSAAALVALAIGVVLKRKELFSEHGQALAPAAAGAGADESLVAGKPSTLPNGLVDPPDTPLPAGAAAAFGQAARGAGRSGQDRSGHPASGQRAYGQPAYGQAAPPAKEAPPGTDWSGTMARQPNPPLRERRADEPAAPAPSWREGPSPARGGAIGSRAPASPAVSPPATPGRPSGPSWFDRHETPAGPELSEVDGDVPAQGATPESPTPEDVMPEANAAEATARKATVQQAGTAPRADAARAETPETAESAEPAPDAAAAADGTDAGQGGATDAGEVGATDAGSSESSTKQVTVVPGVPRYHLEECILIRFMADDDLQKMTVKQATEAGCTPCRACQPGTEAT
jgi:hypothetical protein